MLRPTLLCAGIALSLLFASCKHLDTPAATTSASPAAAAAADTVSSNAILQPWTGGYGGVPAFDRVQIADLEPALQQAIAAHLQELDAIATQTAPATFENTIAAMERSGAMMGRASVYFGILAGNMSSPEFRAVQLKLTPVLADYQTKIVQNPALFARIKAIHNGPEMAQLRPDQRRLVNNTFDSYISSGAQLSGADAARYAQINKELASLSTQFSNNVLADEEKYVLYLSKAQLGGLPESVIAGAAGIAASKGKSDSYAITNTRSSMDPFLTYSTERPLREQVWRTYYSRGDNGADGFGLACSDCTGKS